MASVVLRFACAALAVGSVVASPPPNQSTHEKPPGLVAHLRQTGLNQLAARREKIAKIRTVEQFEQRRSNIRRDLLNMIGGLPSEKTPLNIRKTGVIDRGTYRIEKIIYESLPKFYVTANLYVPQNAKGP